VQNEANGKMGRFASEPDRGHFAPNEANGKMSNLLDKPDDRSGLSDFAEIRYH
jgi:hypothetical protein